jgi:hypothetical protein
MTATVAALCWTLVSGQLLCSSPIATDNIQTAYKMAKDNLDHAAATQVVIVYPNSPQWKSVPGGAGKK